MTIRADVSMGFYTRFLFIGAAVLGFGLWSLYDGFVGFPNQIIRAEKYHEIAQEIEKRQEAGDEEANFASEWVKYAESQDWPKESPGEPQTQVYVSYNKVMAALCIPLGSWLMYSVFAARGRWIEADDSQLRSSWGQELSFDQISRLEKSKWRNKGIAKIFYDKDGQPGKFVVDDFKFKRQETDAILRNIESHIDHSIITGGPLEPLEEAE